MSADPDQATVSQPNPRALASRKRPSTSSSQPAQKEVSVSPYQDISVIKLLNKAKFPVYLTCSQSTKQQFAMKTFPFVNGRPHRYFQNESRFVGLHHNNVIEVEHSENKKPMIHRGCQVEMSYILMEYAPYGDFFDLVNSCKIKDDNKLIRTYFKQLINGMDYLHKHGVAHLDLKLDNLLVGEDYMLKIADFDLSYMTGDEEVLARGTKCYRCPEFIRGRCVNFVAADVYSAGIILFILKSGGLMPHSENTPVKGIDFYDLLYTDNQKFWEKHKQFQKGQDVFDPEFKELFISMTKLNASDRASLEDVKNSKWYSGDVYTDEELSKVMQGHMRS